jgi:ribonuclease HII
MYENQIHQQGYRHILGMDEAGRGAWAGPVTIGAVCLPLGNPDMRKLLTGVNDSKVMTPRQRTHHVEKVKQIAIAWGVGHASSREIDEWGINPATRLAMERALADAQNRYPNFKPDCLFLDAMIWPEKIGEIPQVTIVTRDGLMQELDSELPHYSFGAHKGYGTGSHTAALKTYGISPFHRASYAPIQKIVKNQDR